MPSKFPTRAATRCSPTAGLAYEALDDEWKARLDGLRRRCIYYDYKRDPTLRPSTINPDAPQWVHPVDPHPSRDRQEGDLTSTG